jgi:trans-aconitate methyltransferase
MTSDTETSDTDRARAATDPGDDLWLPTWDASYAANTGHHRAYDDAFFGTTPLRPGDRVLDLGCGPGDFTRRIAELVPDGHVVGLDPQPALLDTARASARVNQAFVLGPVQHLARLFPDAGAFDAILSRAAMQWVPMADHPGYLSQTWRLLRPGGWFRLEMGGAGNIASMIPTLEAISARFGGPRAPWSFPDPGTYLELFEHAGFTVDPERGAYVRSVAQRRRFDRDSLIGWLTSQCVQGFDGDMDVPTAAAFRDALVDAVDAFRRHDGSYDQTYVRLDALVFKPA